jgi:hypothetical protein
MIEISVTNNIEAPAEAVWKVLTDLPRFAEWNPFLRAASGKPAVGATLFIGVETAAGVPLAFRPTVLVCDENRELRWRGFFIAPWLGSGEHVFRLEPAGAGRTCLIHGEKFGGVLPWLLSPLLRDSVRRGFAAMDRALKARVEEARPAAAPVAAAS